MKPFQFHHNLIRVKEIITVLARYGFSNVLQHVGHHAGPFHRLVPKVKERLTTYQRIRRACEDLGPTFVKMGQLLSSRPDLIPEALLNELKNLQEGAKPVPWDDIREILIEELGASPETLFSDIETVPLAAASLAQVHTATIRATGEKVVLKVQRPDIEKRVEADLDIFNWLAELLHNRIDTLQDYDLPGLAQQVADAIRKELDFTNEARNLLRFTQTNGFPDAVGAPKLFDQFTSSRLLVMEKIGGCRPDELEISDLEKKEVAQRGALSLFHQIVIQGFFHADPHPGNLRVLPDGKVIFLDWGMAGHLTRAMRLWLADLIEAILQGDAEMVSHLGLRVSLHPHQVELRALEKEILQEVNYFFDQNTGHGDFGHIILQLLQIFSRHNVGLSRDFALMAKSVLSIEETGRVLDPHFDLREIAEPLIRQLKADRMNPSHTLRWMKLWLGGNLFRIQRLPIEFQRLLGRINDGDLSINLKHQNLQNLRETMDGASNRLSLAIMLGSIVIGSSMIMTTGGGPLLFGFPAIGIIGYTISGILGIWTIVGILRHGRHK